VGHTTNFVQRKYAHKQSCINEKTTNYKCKLYEMIRSLGGWSNWKMEIVGFFNCANQHEARQKEQEFFISLKATLNSIEPYSIKKPIPKIKIYKKDLQEVSLPTNEILEKSDKYNCKSCDFNCSKKSNYDKHVATLKHQNKVEEYKNDIIKMVKKNPSNQYNYTCECGKKYNYYSGLWRHKKKCVAPPVNNEIINETNVVELLIQENKDFKNLIIEMMKSNTDLQTKMMDMCKNSNNTVNM
jgi:hypothetical protein